MPFSQQPEGPLLRKFWLADRHAIKQYASLTSNFPKATAAYYHSFTQTIHSQHISVNNADMNAIPNRLPADGQLLDHGLAWSADDADALLRELLTAIPWQPDQIVMGGKPIQTERLVCWMGDKAFSYRYSGDQKTAKPWPDAELPVKAHIEAVTGQVFNSCLANLYPTGQQGVSWHSDAEPELGPTPTIASVSLGAPRRFVMRHRAGAHADVEVLLRHGSLIVMAGQSQTHWKHQLPKMARVHSPRVNLTFRQIREA